MKARDMVMEMGMGGTNNWRHHAMHLYDGGNRDKLPFGLDSIGHLRDGGLDGVGH